MSDKNRPSELVELFKEGDAESDREAAKILRLLNGCPTISPPPNVTTGCSTLIPGDPTEPAPPGVSEGAATDAPPPDSATVPCPPPENAYAVPCQAPSFGQANER